VLPQWLAEGESFRRIRKNKVWDSRLATRAHPLHALERFSRRGVCVMWESTLFWGLLAASLTNVLFLCVYL
jgi:hypothetical protein